MSKVQNLSVLYTPPPPAVKQKNVFALGFLHFPAVARQRSLAA